MADGWPPDGPRDRGAELPCWLRPSSGRDESQGLDLSSPRRGAGRGPVLSFRPGRAGWGGGEPSYLARGPDAREVCRPQSYQPFLYVIYLFRHATLSLASEGVGMECGRGYETSARKSGDWTHRLLYGFIVAVKASIAISQYGNQILLNWITAPLAAPPGPVARMPMSGGAALPGRAQPR